jgi:CHAT domain-containing protein
VFLSGCETGLTAAGQEPFGQGAEEGSLAQAFLIAGARTVVATLWRVSDEGARELAVRFYRNLLTDGSPAEALARAQRQAIQAHEGLSWAAYSVFGASDRKISMVVRATGETS